MGRVGEGPVLMKRNFELGPEPGKEQGEQMGDACEGVEIANTKHTVGFCSNEKPAACTAWQMGVSFEVG